MKCQNCGEELPDFPQDAVEHDKLEQFVKHTVNPDSVLDLSSDYYCNPECFIEAKGDLL